MEENALSFTVGLVIGVYITLAGVCLALLIGKTDYDPAPDRGKNPFDGVYQYEWEFDNPVNIQIASRETFHSHQYRITFSENEN